MRDGNDISGHLLLDLASDKSPRLHYVGEPAVEFFVRHDLEKKMIMDEPYLARLPDPCVKTEEGNRPVSPFGTADLAPLSNFANL